MYCAACKADQSACSLFLQTPYAILKEHTIDMECSQIYNCT